MCVVVEGVPADLAQEITTLLTIPALGIAAGTGCDGQILVSYDLLGITHDKCPPFVTPLATLERRETVQKNTLKEVIGKLTCSRAT